MKTYTGKEVKKAGVWYPVTIQAESLQDANKKVNKRNHHGEDLRSRFHEVRKDY